MNTVVTLSALIYFSLEAYRICNLYPLSPVTHSETE